MKSETVLIDAIEQALLTRLDVLNRRQLVTALSIPANALGREYKKGLRAEQRKQRRATDGGSMEETRASECRTNTRAGR